MTTGAPANGIPHIDIGYSISTAESNSPGPLAYGTYASEQVLGNARSTGSLAEAILTAGSRAG